MKNKVFILLVLSVFLNFSAFAQEKTKKELKAEREAQKQKEIEALIDSKNFVFEAQKLTPQGGRLINLDYNMYFLNFNTEKTTADLPFFGRGYNVGYGSDGGIKFEGIPENIKVEKKKKNTTIKASVKGKDDVYDLMFTIFYNGGTSLSVNSNNRAPIFYDGEISAPKTDENKK
ncbi:DUF4251 domain-containing protein [Flavobacterium johnsoniae]|uniref:DUF4251 domain-containing protein n=1 Tax=Flavobacterium johnsoniae (strain ATCC 17061 / DSM 2064 / JCM 8514 / BCRC 14874 / CCUG 350202 / NBRC 14942 / NCIMB 11054 / UW101) TaxID=376686 RepID=A5FAK9_FLAJ1|nr:DUF4251 domain-containing protein [Flavobacterium johnsoniae]ABQ07758.1 hypothetical protein Fjoh_4759 [Flavobacterium johnsoniae UW101]OXG01841.1 hypothetical protein B0A63_04055 [Flavobacterium johnsoniae UW101]WQG80401.1 DUF4251 domain-containing protein [Flavobacterium johnsoniae UW101]SHL02896.1 protein of unknown function [Flavobacterium johnsoniae]